MGKKREKKKLILKHGQQAMKPLGNNHPSCRSTQSA